MIFAFYRKLFISSFVLCNKWLSVFQAMGDICYSWLCTWHFWIRKVMEKNSCLQL